MFFFDNLRVCTFDGDTIGLGGLDSEAAAGSAGLLSCVLFVGVAWLDFSGELVRVDTKGDVRSFEEERGWECAQLRSPPHNRFPPRNLLGGMCSRGDLNMSLKPFLLEVKGIHLVLRRDTLLPLSLPLLHTPRHLTGCYVAIF